MYIKHIRIDAFGGVRDLELDLSCGLNIIEGANESGKSSVAMFIKFIFYGLSGRGVDGAMSERSRYVNWETGSAAGYLVLCKGDKEYRVSRELYVSDKAQRESVIITDEATGEKAFRGEVPGEALLGMPEKMFCNSVFVRQLTDASIDGSGMSEAIENILHSGDEGVSTRRALENLEKVRKSLLHKNGNGGRIYELRREKARLETALREAQIKNAEIIETEEAVADSASLISSREKNAGELDIIISGYDKLTALSALEELERYEAEQNRLKATLESYPTVEELKEAEEEMRAKGQELSEAELKLKSVKMNVTALDRTLPPIVSEEEKAQDRLDIIGAARALSAKKNCFGFALALFILTVICGVGAVILRTVDMTLCFVAAGAAALMLVFAVVLLCVSISQLKKLNAILDKWRAVDIEEVERLAAEKVETAEKLRSETSEYGRLLREEFETGRLREEIIATQRFLASKFTEDEPDTDTMTEKALSHISSTLKEISSVTREYDKVSGKLSVMGTKTEEERTRIRGEAAAALETEAGKKASEMSRAEYEKTVRDRGFFRSTAEAQRRRHTALEKELSALAAVAVPPSEIAAKIAETDEELAALTEKYNAVALAIETITKASENLRASLLPRVVGEAGVLLGAFTGGKYTGLGVDRNFDMTYSPAGYTREAEYMSAGTRDAAYISLRSALMKVLFPGNAPMAVYDESFARIDEVRLGRLLSILAAAGDDGMQSLVFTCRSLEGHLSGENIPHIKL